MAECFRCGVSDEKTRLFDIISSKGLVKVCANCSREDGAPVVNKPTDFQLKAAENPSTVYERLSRMQGLDPVKHKEQFSSGAIGKTDAVKKHEANLKKIIDENYQKKILQAKTASSYGLDLVDNFHWVILRARRLRKLTQEQLASEIGEGVASLKMLEAGVLPENDVRLVNKLESFLKVRLMKVPKQEEVKKLAFDSFSTKNLTIADLKKIQESRGKSEMEVAVDSALTEVGDAKPAEKKGFFSRLFGGSSEVEKHEGIKPEEVKSEGVKEEKKKESESSVDEFYE